MRMAYWMAIVFLTCTMSVQAAATEAMGRLEFRPLGVPDTVPVTGVELHRGDLVVSRYYRFSTPGSTSRPAVLFVPGSGCDGGLALGPDGKAKGGLELFALSRLPDANLYTLEPPGLPRQFASQARGTVDGCPTAFYANDSFARLVASYRVAFDDIASRSPKGTPVMIVGMSDGVVLAARLASDTRTTHLVLISGFGAAQSVSHVGALVDTAFDKKSDPTAIAAIRDYRTHLVDAMDHPDAIRQWCGQPLSRWASTAQVSSADLANALPKDTKLLVVQGGRDTNWLPSAFRAGLAHLLAEGRAVTVDYVPCGDHQLACGTASPSPAHLAALVQQAMEWFLRGSVDSSWVVFPEAAARSAELHGGLVESTTPPVEKSH